MEFLTQLWMPIVVSAVFVFIVSSIFHMVLPIHKNDVGKLDKEDAVLDALRAQGVSPGAYMFPCADSMKEMGSPEMLSKFERGPCGWLTILPSGGFNMGKSLLAWFVFCLLVATFVAYVAWFAFLGEANPHYLKVFQITGTAAILGYVFGHAHESMWKGVRWRVSVKYMFDGLVYALVTAGTFGWLWPQV